MQWNSVNFLRVIVGKLKNGTIENGRNNRLVVSKHALNNYFEINFVSRDTFFYYQDFCLWNLFS